MSGHKKYPVRIPRYASGIKMQETRSSGRSWWARRWMEALEVMGLKGRLGRGRDYAVRGQVVSMTIEGSLVTAVVQGTRENPYSVELRFRAPQREARQTLIADLASEPMLVARLLADDLPTEVELLFKKAGCDLFPGAKLGPGKYDMTSSCSCPDYANPCKHVVAALMVLGEEISRRPLVLLALRGISMEELYDED